MVRPRQVSTSTVKKSVTGQNGHVGGNEILPGGILAPLRCRLDPISAKDVAHCLIGNGVAEIGQGSDDAVVSPGGVFSGEAHNEGFQFRRDAGPAWSGAVFRAIELARNESPVPSEDGIGFGDCAYRKSDLQPGAGS